jgi:hypothetical protein
VLGAAGLVLAALAGLAALLLAPNRLASIRLGSLGLAWWGAGAVALVMAWALVRGSRVPASGAGAPTGALTALGLAAVWGSPALLVGLPPLVLADGTRGVWPAVALGGGAVAALLLLGEPWSRRGGAAGSASALARRRWPAERALPRILGAAEVATALLFLWAQLLAAREVGALIGRPGATVIALGAALLAAALLREPRRGRLAALGAGLALAGVAVPLAATAVATSPSWPRAWAAAASRMRVVFDGGEPGDAAARAVHGRAGAVALSFDEAQRVAVERGARVALETPGGAPLALELGPGEELALHPGDRLVVPGGLAIRFEGGRRVPGAPASGPEWVDPPGRRSGWLQVVGLGVTCVVGMLGLAPGAAVRAGAARAPRGALRAAGALVLAAIAVALGWGLYAAWLGPAVYAGGVTGAEVYAVPADVGALGAHGPRLAWLAQGALAVGVLAAGLAAVRGFGETWPGRGARAGPGAVVGGAVALAALVPADAFTVLAGALALGAAALAPAAVLACWSERATATGLAAGAATGLAAFVGVVVVGPLAARPSAAALGALLPAAAVAGVVVHGGVAWLLRSRRAIAPRAPLPAGLAALHGPAAAAEGPVAS